jgi:hypothetical protein
LEISFVFDVTAGCNSYSRPLQKYSDVNLEH